jgi:spermidine/putrescine transport system substrate-binding protein
MRPEDPDVTDISSRKLSRAQFLAVAGAGAAALAGCGSSSSSSSKASSAASSAAAKASSGTTTYAKGGSVNLWTWPQYWSPKNIALFEQTTGTHVNMATYDSNDAAFAKLNASGGSSGFDLVIPTSDFVPVMASHGLIQKIEHSRIPWQYVNPKLLGQVFDPHNEYSVPKDYGTIGVIYDPTVVKTPITTWQDFLNAGAQPGISGKVEVPDVPDENLGIALWAAGESWNTDNLTELNQAADVMKKFAKHVKAFNEFDTSGVASGAVVMAVVTQGTARLMIQQKPHLKFVVPQPQSELWVDNYCIVTNAPNINQAYSFINFMLQPAQQLRDVPYIGYPTALPGIEQKLPANVPLRDLIFIKPADFARLVPHVIHPSIQGQVENLYSQIHAAAA